MTVFGDYGRAYDLLYAEKDYNAEADFVVKLIRDQSADAKTILDLGCGSGIHAEKYAEAGFEVFGVDRSPTMLDLAQTRRNKAAEETQRRLTFLKADIRALDLGRSFDAVSSLFHVMSYMPENVDLVSAFAGARAHLKTGGLFIFDYWYGPAVLHVLPSPRLKYLENEHLKLWRFAEPVLLENENLVEVHYTMLTLDKARLTVNETKETHRMRYFFNPELTYLLQQGGFKFRAAWEWMSGALPSKTTWNVVCTAEAV